MDEGYLSDWEKVEIPFYNLRLYVAGASTISVRAIHNIKQILEANLKDRYELEVIDIHQQPSLLKEENIFAVPLLVKRSPKPLRRLVGDMSDTAKVLKGLGLN